MPKAQRFPTARNKEHANWLMHRTAAAVATYTGIPLALIIGKERGLEPISRARQTAMYLCSVLYGIPFRTVGKFFGKDRTTASAANRVIEDLRDYKDFNAFVSELETILLSTEVHSLVTHFNDRIETVPLAMLQQCWEESQPFRRRAAWEKILPRRACNG